MKLIFEDTDLKPTKEAEELAKHELPILRNNLRKVDEERRTILAQILFYENIISQVNKVPIKNETINTENLVSEYSKRKTYSEKILFITEHPYLYGKELIEGKSDIVKIIYGIEKNAPFTDIVKLKRKLESSIPSVLSRLYNEGKILKYRYVGTKGKFVVINPSWLVNGEFEERYRLLTKNIEPIK